MAKNMLLQLSAVMLLALAGAAGATYCAAGYKDCDKNAQNGCETNVHTDRNNCGNCGVKCGACANAASTCKSGKCEFSCTSPYQNCDNSWTNGCEINTSNDANNCGGCGKKCSPVANANVKCSNGKCEYTCRPGWNNCDNNWMNGCETEVSMNVNNCGACGVKCGAKANAVAKCQNHKCVYTCKAPFMDCNKNWADGCERNTGSDVNNCGGCNQKCPMPKYRGGEARCTNGKCDMESCKKGMKYNKGRKCCVGGDDGKGGKYDDKSGGKDDGKSGGKDDGKSGGKDDGKSGGKDDGKSGGKDDGKSGGKDDGKSGGKY